MIDVASSYTGAGAAAVAACLLVTACGAPEPTANKVGVANATTSAPAAPGPKPTIAAPIAATPGASTSLTAQGWGPLTIGMSLSQITAALGPDAEPDKVGGPDPASCDQFRPARAPAGILVMTENNLLTRVSVISGTLETNRGFGIGDAAAAVKAAYGSAAFASPHKYSDPPAEYVTAWFNRPASAEFVRDPAARGIVYEIGSEGRVAAIHAGGPSIQYVEGCL